MHNFDPNIVIALISVLIAFASLIIATIRNGHTDVEKQLNEAKRAAMRDTEIKMGLNAIQSDTSEIKGNMATLKDEVADQGRRLIIVEQSAKSAHHRIDALEEKHD